MSGFRKSDGSGCRRAEGGFLEATQQSYQVAGATPCAPALVDIPEPELAAFYDYWRGKRKGGAWPSRAEIDPTELRELLPHLLIADVLDGGHDFRFRLMGTHLTDRIGLDATGRNFRDFEGDRGFGDFMSGVHRQTLNWGVPVYGGGQLKTAYGTEHVCRRVMCPLSEDGTRIDKIISCVRFVHGGIDAEPARTRGRVNPVFAFPLEPSSVNAR